MREDIFNGFYEKFNVKTRPGRGGNYPYVPVEDVTDRMNKLFKGSWSTMVTFQDIIGGNVIVRVKVEATDPESGQIFFHEGYGGQKDDPGAEAGNAFKSAYSKAIVSACKRWGVGLYLQDEGVDPVPVQNTTTVPATKPVAAIPSEVIQGAGPAIPPVSTQTAPAQSAEVKVEQVPKTPPVSIPKAAGVPWQQSEAMPKIPTPSNEMATLTEAVSPTQHQPLEITTKDRISDVQKISIESLETMRGVSYADMAQGALGKVPDVNTLTHDEAVLVIQHGNALYKKNKQK